MATALPTQANSLHKALAKEQIDPTPHLNFQMTIGIEKKTAKPIGRSEAVQVRSAQLNEARERHEEKQREQYSLSPSLNSSKTESDSGSEYLSSEKESDDVKARCIRTNKKWKNQFIITSSIFKLAKRGKYSTKCDVARFKHGIDISIINWII